MDLRIDSDKYKSFLSLHMCLVWQDAANLQWSPECTTVLPRRTLYNYYLYYISLQLRETILKRQYVTNLLTEPLLEMLPHLRHDLAAEEVQEYDTHSKGESQTKI